MTSLRISCAALLVGLIGLSSARAETLVQWGENPSGPGTPGTNIVSANQLLVGAGSTFTGNTNNPPVGANYYPDNAGRSPYFSAAVSSITNAGARVVEQAASGDRLTLYGATLTPGQAFRAMVMWSSNLFLSISDPLVLTNITMVMNQRLSNSTTNQAVRVILRQNDTYFASGPAPFGASVATNVFAMSDQTWFSFTPFAAGVETIGDAVAAPSFTNVQAVGYYFSAENGSGVASNAGLQVSFFAAEGVSPSESATFTLSATSADPLMGSVSPTGGVYSDGSEVELTATASNYYQFAGWSGDLGGITNPVTIAMTANKTIVASFTAVLATNETPLWWLADNNLPTDDSGALSDTDGDGLFAWQEYIAGTQPTNPASVFITTSLRTLSGSGVLQWNSLSGRVYQVGWSTNATGVYTAFGDATAISWPVNSYTDAIHGAERTIFYQIKVRRDP